MATTEAGYARIVDPELARTVGRRLGELRRSDLARFFRASHLDSLFPAEAMVPALRDTLAGLGIDLDAQSNVMLDTEARPTKSPRAFCSTPRVPEEVYLVLPPIGGREDYAALFHEAGHAEHYGCTDAELAFEFRHLGDNGVTESFAFLLEGLTANGEWLARFLGVDEAEAAIEHARAARLVMLRRYSAKIAYEVELHAPGADLSAMPERYSALLGERIGVAVAARDLALGRRFEASTSPATCAPGPWRWTGAPGWGSASGRRGSTIARRENGCAGSGRRASGSMADGLLAEATGGALDFERLASRAGSAYRLARHPPMTGRA